MEENKKEVIQVPIEDILPNRFQPRLTFDDSELQELANSIIRYGVIQPIVLRKLGDKYEIVAGERRYKASTIAGLSKVPAILVDTDDNTSAEIALLENLQRKNLTVIEEAQSYKKLIDRGFTQDEIAVKLGISQSSIANKIRLLNLPDEVQDALLFNKISERHARCLLTLSNPDLQKELLKKIIDERLTVRQTEDEINFINRKDEVMNEDIPVDIQRFLNPEPKKVEVFEGSTSSDILDDVNKDVEVLDFKSDVIDIDEITEKIDNEVVMNPFQESHKELIDRLDNSRINISTTNNYKNIDVIDDVRDEENVIDVVDNDMIDEDNYQSDEFTNDGDINLPIMINRVRDFIRKIDNDNDSITIDEVDMADSYQIIINIKKD